MNLPKPLIQSFWKLDAKLDAARLAKQDFPEDVEQICDINYAKDKNEWHTLDVYYPKDTKPNAKLPVIIDIHGGGWFYGSKEINKNYCLHLAQRGFVVFNINYRLVPDVTNNEQVQDCMLAVKFIAKHLGNYPCNKSRLYLTGDSAGGQLAGYVAAATVSKKMRDAFSLVDPGVKFKAVSLVSPCPYLEKKGLLKSYVGHVIGKKWKSEPYGKYFNFDKVVKSTKGNYPPTIIFTSLADVIANGQSSRARKILKKCGTKVKYDYKYKLSLNHVYQVLVPDNRDSVAAIDRMVKFFNKHK